MSREFPDFIDPWKAADGRRTFQGTMPLKRLKRLGPMLAPAGDGLDEQLVARDDARFSARFSYDEQGLVTIRLEVEAELPLICQRSLAPYREKIARRSLLVAIEDVAEQELIPESYDPVIPDELVYSGTKSLTDPTEIPGVNAGKMVLSPTRTYAPVISEVLKSYRKDIHGMIHCSGGAQTKVLHFIDKLHVVKDKLFPVPPLFMMIREESGTGWKEMYQVFNMGHRFELYVPENIAADIISISRSFEIDAQVVGHVEDSEAAKLTISSEHGTYFY